jgi:hypothetical protein
MMKSDSIATPKAGTVKFGGIPPFLNKELQREDIGAIYRRHKESIPKALLVSSTSSGRLLGVKDVSCDTQYTEHKH